MKPLRATSRFLYPLLSERRMFWKFLKVQFSSITICMEPIKPHIWLLRKSLPFRKKGVFNFLCLKNVRRWRKTILNRLISVRSSVCFTEEHDNSRKFGPIELKIGHEYTLFYKIDFRPIIGVDWNWTRPV